MLGLREIILSPLTDNWRTDTGSVPTCGLSAELVSMALIGLIGSVVGIVLTELGREKLSIRNKENIVYIIIQTCICHSTRAGLFIF